MRHSILLTIILLSSLVAAPVKAQEIRISTENDILTSNPTPDDLYSYSLAIDVDRHGFTGSFRENAFTDRAAGIRFEETYLSVGHPLTSIRGWDVAAEAGVVHVGRGLFGQRFQNTFHRLIGSRQLHLRYMESSIHPRVALTADRRIAVGRSLTWGPLLELDLVPGLRSWALAAVEATWSPARDFAMEVQGGSRFAHASYAPLEPHIKSRSAAARLGVVLYDHFFVSWSYDDYGDGREHLSAGWRIGG